MWQAENWVTGSSTVGNCRHFGHEGSGVQCDVIYPWKEGIKYQFQLKIKKVGVRKGLQLTIIDLASFKELNIATVILPSHWRGLKHTTSSFVEEYSQGNQQLESCHVIPSASAVFFKPLANVTVSPTRTSTKTYGTCNSENTTHSSCDEKTGKCITNIADNQGKAGIFKLENITSGYCADTLWGNHNEGATVGVWNCTNNNNQLWKYNTDDLSIRLAVDEQMCLTAAVTSRVILSKCAQNAAQSWSVNSVTNELVNGLGQCLDINKNSLEAIMLVGNCMSEQNVRNNKRLSTWKRISVHLGR